MLAKYITQFLDYCQTANFAAKSLQTLRLRLLEFDRFLHSRRIRSVQKIRYLDISAYITDGVNPSLHVKKARIWTLRLFFHFLKLRNVLDVNLAKNLRYPPIRKTVPRYLTAKQFSQLVEYFAKRSRSSGGSQNLIIILLLGLFGLRLSTLLHLNVEHVDTENLRLLLFDKGRTVRMVYLPLVLCRLLKVHIKLLSYQQGPLLLSQRGARLNPQSVQKILQAAGQELDLDFNLHAHIFRHTAATQINKVAGVDIVQNILGHSRWENTLQYTHLNPDIYAVYMKRHPYHSIQE
jgi:site-specific recombinase XerD